MSVTYHLDECGLVLPSGFEDHSVNVLQWRTHEGHYMLAIERALLPEGMNFLEAVQQHGARDAASLERYAEEEVRVVDLDRPCAGRAFSGFIDGRLIYHQKLYVHCAPGVMVLTARGTRRAKRHIDEVFDRATSGLRFR